MLMGLNMADTTVIITVPAMVGVPTDAIIKATIPSDAMELILPAMLAQYGYQPTIPDPDWTPADDSPQTAVTNPESPVSFFVRMIRENFLNPIAVQHRVDQDVAATRTNSQASAQAVLATQTQTTGD